MELHLTHRAQAKIRGVVLTAVLAILSSLPASAHHSFAMFDSSRSLEMTGVVKEFDWINPHSWLQLVVTDPHGETNGWSIEMGAPAQLQRMGLEQTSLRPGDKVTVNIHPLKDGSYGGQLVKLALPNGQTIEVFRRSAAPDRNN